MDRRRTCDGCETLRAAAAEMRHALDDGERVLATYRAGISRANWLNGELLERVREPKQQRARGAVVVGERADRQLVDAADGPWGQIERMLRAGAFPPGEPTRELLDELGLVIAPCVNILPPGDPSVWREHDARVYAWDAAAALIERFAVVVVNGHRVARAFGLQYMPLAVQRVRAGYPGESGPFVEDDVGPGLVVQLPLLAGPWWDVMAQRRAGAGIVRLVALAGGEVF